MPALLSVRDVCKSFGDFRAVDRVSFDVEEGSVYGFLGPNGAGKTTTIRMIVDIILPDSGEIRFDGGTDAETRRFQVGYLPEERGLYPKMKVGDALRFFAEIRGLERNDAKVAVGKWIERFDLGEWEAKKVKELSRGMQQKLQFITTVIHHPKLIILDEPFSGLDPINTEVLRQVIKEEVERGATIVFSTHLMREVEELCDSICLIHQGRIALEGNLRALKREHRGNRVRIEAEGDLSELERLEAVASCKHEGSRLLFELNEGASHQAILQEAAKRATIYRFEVVEPSLEEIFIETVKGRPTRTELAGQETTHA